MLRTGFVPFYFDDFNKAKELVGNLDLDQMMAYMDAVEEAQVEKVLDEECIIQIEKERSSETQILNRVECTQTTRCNCSHIPCLCDAYKSIEVNKNNM